MLPLTREKCGLTPRQCSHQFRERAIALVQDGRDVRALATELGIAAATTDLWHRQARIDAGEIVGINSAMASELDDSIRIRQQHVVGPAVRVMCESGEFV